MNKEGFSPPIESSIGTELRMPTGDILTCGIKDVATLTAGVLIFRKILGMLGLVNGRKK